MSHQAFLTAAAAPTHAVARPWRGLLFTGVLCTVIAVVITVLDRGGFGIKLVYSLAIGLSCWALIDGMRMAVNGLVKRARRHRGDALDGPDFLIGWRSMIPLALLAILFGPPLGLTIGDALTGGRSTSLLQLGATSTRLTLAFSVIGTLASVFVVSTLERLAAARASAERAQRVAAEAQLRLLQSQLEPHMLFNTLANLRVLIGVDAARAQVMLDHLNAFLRATLSASRAVHHPLADEFARLADYLALMAVRMGPRLQLRLDLPDELADLPVPPLLLQPLVENSIKHGLEPKLGGGRIDITARREGQHLVLAVRDTGAGPGAAAPGSGGGFGLTQVHELLATVYGGRASLALQAASDAEGGTLATLRLPIVRANRTAAAGRLGPD